MIARRFVLAVLTCALSLPGCGFRLAGTAGLPPQLASIHLEADTLDARQRAALQRTLQAAGATLAGQADAQAAVLRVTLKSEPDRQLATGASSGDTVKRVSRRLDFSIRDAAGELLAPAGSLRQQRDIAFDEDNLLAANRERDAVAAELEQALYEQMVRQLSRL